MSIAKHRASEESRVDEGNDYFDHEALALTIDLVLNADEHAPHFLGQLFTSFRQAIDSGLQGINETRRALAEAIDLIYLHSPEHDAAINLYRLHLEGELKPDDEPLDLINAAIKRTTRGLSMAKSSRHKRKT
ncbi:MAG TPA: hypothetical protein VNG71_21810 [Pyrinomonadaceae bacterium]|nr:hypothetical protein [Pyrinomonadaceae bacterium]